MQESNFEIEPGEISHKYLDNSLSWSSPHTSNHLGAKPENLGSKKNQEQVYSGYTGVQRTLEGIYGVETLTGTLKRSHSVGVSQITVFDRHHPARQSLAGELERSTSVDVNGDAKGKNLRSFVEKSFIPKPNKSKQQGKCLDNQR